MSRYDLLNRGLQLTPTTDVAEKLHFLALNTGRRLEIQFMPSVISNERTADVSTMKIVGRSTPKYQIVGGEEILKLTLDFFADELSRQSVMAKCQWLKSLTYTDGSKNPATRVALIFGKLFNKEKWTVRRVNIDYSNFNKKYGFLPQQATVDIELVLDTDTNLEWQDVLPDYTFGEPDGLPANKYAPDAPVASDEDTKWLTVDNSNNIQTLLLRAAQRFRIDLRAVNAR